MEVVPVIRKARYLILHHTHSPLTEYNAILWKVFLQSLKFKEPDMQKEVCQLVGKAAKFRGKKKKWQRTQTLYWQGNEYKRDSEAYQDLLDRAFRALSENAGFQKALLATGTATLTHSMGKNKISETVLTKQEFCSRLTAIRAELRSKNS